MKYDLTKNSCMKVDIYGENILHTKVMFENHKTKAASKKGGRIPIRHKSLVLLYLGLL